MKRRDFISLVGGAVAWPVVSRAQSALRRVGVLVPLPETDGVFRGNIGAFTASLKSAGWVEGHNLDLRVVSIIGSGKTPDDAAADVLAVSPNVVLAITPIAAGSLHRLTSVVPVVFVVGWFDPVQEGFVRAINQPGSNMTGVTDLVPSLGGKWVQLLKQVAPKVTRAGIVFNPDEGMISASVFQSIKESARRVALDLVDLPIRKESEIELVIYKFASDPKGGLVFPLDFFTTVHRKRIIAVANNAHIPTIFAFRYFAVDGGLVAYSPSQPDEFGQAAYFVDRILRGDSPANLPVQTPNKYELTINLKTARALGLHVPDDFLSAADEVIE